MDLLIKEINTHVTNVDNFNKSIIENIDKMHKEILGNIERSIDENIINPHKKNKKSHLVVNNNKGIFNPFNE